MGNEICRNTNIMGTELVVMRRPDQRQHCHDDQIEFEDCLPILVVLVELPPTVNISILSTIEFLFQ